MRATTLCRSQWLEPAPTPTPLPVFALQRTGRYFLRLHAALGRENKVHHKRNVRIPLSFQRALQLGHCRARIREVYLHVVLEGLDEVRVLRRLDHLGAAVKLTILMLTIMSWHAKCQKHHRQNMDGRHHDVYLLDLFVDKGQIAVDPVHFRLDVFKIGC